MSVHLFALPEYEPPRQPTPPVPEDLDVPYRPLLAPPRCSPGPGPVWNEPGEMRDRLSRLVCLMLEVLDGRRQPAALRGMITPAVHESLSRRKPGPRHRLRTLHTCRPVPDTLELCATVLITAAATGPRTIAVVARLTRHDGRWLCTLLRPIYPNPHST